VGVWASPTPPQMPAFLLAVAFFRSLLVSRLGSSMKKSFAFGEAVGLTPFAPFGDAARGREPRRAAGATPAPNRTPAPAAHRRCGAGGCGGRPPARAKPPASCKTSPLPRLDSLLRRVTLAGGGPPLRYGLLREGKGWGVKASPIRQAPGGAAMKVQVESSPDGISLRTSDTPH
jgi:hypothetical protein